MAKQPLNPFEQIADASGLTDADWTAINKLKHAFVVGGADGVATALDQLSVSDPIRYVYVLGALFPDMVREAIEVQMAESGLPEDDTREVLRKLERRTTMH